MSFGRTAKWGRRQEAIIGYRINAKEEESIKYLIGCGHIVNLVGGEKGEGNKDTAQGWFVVWGLSDCICCISGQVEHLQGKENYLSFC